MQKKKSKGNFLFIENCNRIVILGILFFIVQSNLLKAEGSKDLYPSGAIGNRAFLMSTICNSCSYNPFPTIGRHYVYAKEGETIYTGSSVADAASRIKIYSPNGKLYTSTATTGLISNRAQELVGPKITGTSSASTGYTPFSVNVATGEDGIWVVEFYSRGTSTTQTNMAVSANSEWSSTQSSVGTNSAFIAAWDVTLASGINIKSGRVYINVFNGSIYTDSNTATSGFFGKFYALTKDGFVYKIDNNGQNGYSFNNFVNNKGTTYIQNETDKVNNKGLSTGTNYSTALWDPRKFDGFDKADNTNNNGDKILNVTHKMFYQKPGTDIPEKAIIFWSNTDLTTWTTTGQRKEIWLKPIRRTPDLQSIRFEGVEGTLNTAGLKGGYFIFNSHVIGEYTITIPIASSKITLKGQLALGENKIYWNGKNSNGEYILENGISLTGVRIDILGAEVHFPFLDVESNYNGLYIELLDENMNLYSPTKDIVYWNLTSKPTGVIQKNLTGLNSTSGQSNRLYWQDGTSPSTGFGNDKAINIWANVQDSHIIQNGPMIIYRSSDLQVTAINKTTGAAKIYSGASLEYTVDILNSGNLANENEFAATFMLFLPIGAEVNLNEIKFSSTNNSTLVKNSEEIIDKIIDLSTQGVMAYKVKINMPINGNGKFIIPVKVSQNYTYSRFNAWATILRAKDTQDPNATNPNLDLTPTDPFVEANGLYKKVSTLNLNGDYSKDSNFTNLLDSTLPTTSSNYTNNIKVMNTNVLTNVCVQPANRTSKGLTTNVGINTQTIKTAGWPENIPNGFITMETTNKGFSITRVSKSDDIKKPIDGMIIYDKSSNCIKLYREGVWNCITRTCNY